MGKIDELTNEASAMQKPVSDIAERGGSGAIAQLIQQYCPDGVEYVKLGEVCKTLQKGTLTTKELVEPDGNNYPVINSGRELYGYYPEFNNEGDAITVAARGEYAGYITFFSERFWAGGLCYPYRSSSSALSTKFIFYYLKSRQEYIRNTLVAEGSIPALNKGTLEQFEIPVPPLPVQEAIVNILDRFAVYAAELQAELQARQQQYNYYRDTLLSFEGREDVQWKKLGEMCIYAKERIGADLMNENNYVSVENLLPNQRGKEKASNVPKEGNCIKFEPNDVLIGNIRPYLHKIWYADCVGGTNGDVLCVRIKDDAKNVIIPRYLYCILSSHSFFEYDNSYSKGAKMPRGDKQKVMEYEFGIPSLSEQQRIVDILDRFDTLVNDLSQGLPAEIEARQQQYEYYRDKLLTFKKKEA